MKKRTVFLLTALILLHLACGSAMAAAIPDLTAMDGSIHVTMRAGGESIPDGSLTCYRVGDVQMDGGGLSFVPTAEFAPFRGALNDITSPALASRLADYAAREDVSGTTCPIGKDGAAVFRDLQPGLYLIVQNEAAPGYYAAEPFLVTLPMREDGRWVYDVDASPKVEPEKPGRTHTQENPDVPDDTPYTPDDSQPKLPQTGQLNWPVPVLAAGGLCLLLLGRVLRGGKRGRHED